MNEYRWHNLECKRGKGTELNYHLLRPIWVGTYWNLMGQKRISIRAYIFHRYFDKVEIPITFITHLNVLWICICVCKSINNFCLYWFSISLICDSLKHWKVYLMMKWCQLYRTHLTLRHNLQLELWFYE